MIQIGPVTAEILLPKSLYGGEWWVVGGEWWVVCKPILVFSLSLGQAEQLQNLFDESYEQNLIVNKFNCCQAWIELWLNQADTGFDKRY